MVDLYFGNLCQVYPKRLSCVTYTEIPSHVQFDGLIPVPYSYPS